ncbi:hypothetical protein [Streptomyces atratus]|uniref:hypothetical protein n=1 Tax=Streptomyces atratus TaxID=1893 RepID=UPI00225490CE|nr:hypothetical protein [Streptomyces atratus]MCX5345909.1 hypothetical protein [Streptomyces atratus]
MGDSEIQQPDLASPGWFGDVAAWWVPALRSKGFAARVEPLGVDAQMRLHVLCESPAWRTQPQLIGKPVLRRHPLSERDRLVRGGWA